MADELADSISHVVRFAGDSGDGIQLQGQQFTVASALSGPGGPLQQPAKIAEFQAGMTIG